MPLIRGHHSFDDHFTQIPNAWLRDSRISLGAKGLLAQLLSHSPGWRISQESLAYSNGIGRDAIRTLINELLDAGYLDSAEPYLLKAQAIEESAFTTKMLGAIEVNRGNFDEGIDLLTRSLAINPKDPQAKFNLSGAYAQNGNLPKALEIAREIQRESPSFPGIQPWVAQLERFVN